MRTPDQKGTVKFHQQLESRESKPGSAIKRCERTIIPFNARGRQEEAHEHVVDVKKRRSKR